MQLENSTIAWLQVLSWSMWKSHADQKVALCFSYSFILAPGTFRDGCTLSLASTYGAKSLRNANLPSSPSPFKKSTSSSSRYPSPSVSCPCSSSPAREDFVSVCIFLASFLFLLPLGMISSTTWVPYGYAPGNLRNCWAEHRLTLPAHCGYAA